MKLLPVLLLLFNLGALPLAAQEPGTTEKGRSAQTIRPPAVFVFRPDVSYQHNVKPGGIVRIFARSAGGIDGMTAYLSDSNGRVITRAVFFRSVDSFWAGLLGIPSTLPGADYRLVVSAEQSSRAYLDVFNLSVIARPFATEDIPLDQGLTTLLAVPDPKKTAEAVALYGILTTPHQDAVFEEGTFAKPVTPRRKSAGYGDRRRYVYAKGGSDLSVHNGIDYALDEGSPVAACGAGRVVMAAVRIMTGNTVIVEHLPGFFSLYFHLSRIDVKEGDVVEKGQALGRVGHTGLATGPHLHWEVEVGGVAVDPEGFLDTPILDKSPAFGSILGQAN